MNKKNVKIIDFTNKLKKLDKPIKIFPFQKHGHFNEVGYSLLYEHIIDIIKNN